MGLGSFLAKYVHRDLLRAFVEIEIWIGLVGGTSSILMFATNAFIEELFGVVFYTLCALLGALVGIEIPLLVRILRSGQELSSALSHVLALDYVGALAGSLLFPFVALPWLGLSRSSIVFGLMNLAVAAAGTMVLSPPRRWVWARLGVAFTILVAATLGSTRLVGFLEDLLYQDSIIFARNTAYQRIVLTRWRDDVRLYLNGHIQLSSIDEARYHEALVIPAMAAAARPRRILVLGGGDGMAAREVLKYPAVEAITLVDIDPVMTTLARERPELLSLNDGSLRSSKLTVVNQDAMSFLQSDRHFYDVVIVDLPDPSTPALAKLYSRAFYALIAHRLAAGGVMVTQATSPFFAREAFWCIVHTVEDAIATEEIDPLLVVPFHVHVPSFGEWGFVLAATHRVDPSSLSVTVPTRFLDDPTLQAMFVFGKDITPVPTDINRLDSPALYQYYDRGWAHFNE
jgi:spermidine synthase